MRQRKISKIMAAILFITMLAGCGSKPAIESGNADNAVNTATSGSEASGAVASGVTTSGQTVAFVSTDSDMFTDRDFETAYDKEACVHIQLNGDSATADSESVQLTGSTVTLTEEAVYVISGTLNDGRIVVNADEKAKLQLVFDGISVNSENSAALYILSADKVFVTLADGTENRLSNGGSFENSDDNKIDGAVFSKEDLTFNGNGSLMVSSPGGHGIVCKDDLVFAGGSFFLASASHGIDANDSVRISRAVLSIDAGKDGIHAENDEDTEKGFVYISGGELTIEADGDGISAGAWMQIADGEIELSAGGGYENGTKQSSALYGGFMGKDKPGKQGGQTDGTDTTDDSVSMKGLKAAGSICISDGIFSVNTADDAIHSNTSVAIYGGSFELSSGDDAVHAEDILTITDCRMQISQSYEGLEAQTLIIGGGTITVNASDDGLNAAGGKDASGMTGGRDGMFGGGMGAASNGTIEITGGTVNIYAGGDAIDANGSLAITGGTIRISGANMGDTSILDFDSTGTISGGTFIGTGASGMAQNFSDTSTQGVIMKIVETQAAGTQITLTDSDGNELVSHTANRDFSCIIISVPGIVKGETYTLTVGSNESTVTMDNTMYGNGGAGGMNGGPGGGRNGSMDGAPDGRNGGMDGAPGGGRNGSMDEAPDGSRNEN